MFDRKLYWLLAWDQRKVISWHRLSIDSDPNKNIAKGQSQVFKQIIEEKTSMELETPFMENSIKKINFVFGILTSARATSFKVSIHWATETSQWVSVSVLDKHGELLYQGDDEKW